MRHRGRREYAGQICILAAVSMPFGDESGGRAYKYPWRGDGKVRDPFLPRIEAEIAPDADAPAIEAKAIDALRSQIMESLQVRGV